MSFIPPRRLIEFQPGVTRDAEHKYHLNGVQMAASVTERISQHLTGKFDSADQSAGLFALCAEMRDNPDRIYSVKQRAVYEAYKNYRSPQEMADAWQQNRDRGVRMHSIIEQLLRGQIAPTDPLARLPEVQHFLSFYAWFSRTHDVLATESMLAMPSISTGGSPDCVWQAHVREHPNDVIIMDWKKMAPQLMDEKQPHVPFFDLPNCKRTSQEVQVNMYAHMIESMTPYRVVRLLVLYFDERAETWDWADVPLRRDETADFVSALRESVDKPLFMLADTVKAERGLIASGKRVNK